MQNKTRASSSHCYIHTFLIYKILLLYFPNNQSTHFIFLSHWLSHSLLCSYIPTNSSSSLLTLLSFFLSKLEVMENSSSYSDQKSGTFSFSSCFLLLWVISDLYDNDNPYSQGLIFVLLLCYFCCEDSLEAGNGSEFKVHVFSSSSEVRIHNSLHHLILYTIIFFWGF